MMSTELGFPVSAIAMNSVLHPLQPLPGFAGKPSPCTDDHVVNDEGIEVRVGELGNIVL